MKIDKNLMILSWLISPSNIADNPVAVVLPNDTIR